MDPTDSALLLDSIGTVKGAIKSLAALATIFGLAYAGASRVAVLRGRALKRAFRIIRKSRKQAVTRLKLLRQTMDAAEIQAKRIRELEREIRREQGIRSKLDRGMKIKSAELDQALSDLRWAEKMRAPVVQNLTVDFDPTIKEVTRA